VGWDIMGWLVGNSNPTCPFFDGLVGGSAGLTCFDMLTFLDAKL